MKGRFFRRTAAWTLLALGLWISAAGADAALSFREEDAETAGERTITGTVTADREDTADAVWHLALESDGDAGSLLFTEINGKQLKMRKRSDTVEADYLGGTENTFTALWYLPEGGGDPDGVSIRFSLTDAAGTEITAGTLTTGGASSPAEEAESLLNHRIHLAVLILFPLGALLWAAACIRSLMTRRNRAGRTGTRC